MVRSDERKRAMKRSTSRFRFYSNLAIKLLAPAALFLNAACSDPANTPINHTDSDPVVSVAQGDLKGARNARVMNFKGIPYAAPPTGKNRWSTPAPPLPWAGERDAKNFGPSCIQPPVPKFSVYYDPPVESSEDCLTLNIWAPQQADKAPVIVFIHGGSLRMGGSAQPTYDGTEFANRGAVFVSINYRLGVLGWMAHPDLSAESASGVSGNYGLLDQTAALKWVRDNIQSFGGDPHNVTIMGESAGALSTTYLLTHPGAEGLFHKAIIQSTNTRNFPALKTQDYGLPSAETIGTTLFSALKIETLDAARAMDPQVLTDQAMRMRYGPQGTIDGVNLPDQLNILFDSGQFSKVPLLAGFNSGESRTYKALLPTLPENAESYEQAIQARYGEISADYLNLYPANDMAESALGVARDNIFGWATERLVKRVSEQGAPAYLYLFDYCYPAAKARDLCAFHASELPFVFGTLSHELFPPNWPVPDREAAEELSKLLLDYWVSFAATGQPTHQQGPVWPDYAKDEAYLHISETSQTSNNLYPGMYEFHEWHYEKQREVGKGWFMNVGLSAPLMDAD